MERQMSPGQYHLSVGMWVNLESLLWSVWIPLGKVRTLWPSVKKHHNSESITPTSNPWAVDSLRVCLGPEEPIGSQDAALPLFHWMSPPWSVSGIIFPSKELEEVCSMMNAEVFMEARGGRATLFSCTCSKQYSSSSVLKDTCCSHCLNMINYGLIFHARIECSHHCFISYIIIHNNSYIIGLPMHFIDNNMILPMLYRGESKINIILIKHWDTFKTYKIY